MIALVAALLMQTAQGQSGPWEDYRGNAVVMTPASAGLLAQVCRNSDDLENDTCNMYIWGVADALSAHRLICPPTESWTIIAARLVKNRMRDHPEALAYHPYFLIRDALIAQYPCRRARR